MPSYKYFPPILPNYHLKKRNINAWEISQNTIFVPSPHPPLIFVGIDSKYPLYFLLVWIWTFLLVYQEKL